MKIFLVCLLLVNMSLHSATMRVYNKSDQTIRVGIHEDTQKIEPGKSVWFNSGLKPITIIDFYIPGRAGSRCLQKDLRKYACEDLYTNPIGFLANIGTFEVEQKIEYYGPTNIKKL